MARIFLSADEVFDLSSGQHSVIGSTGNTGVRLLSDNVVASLDANVQILTLASNQSDYHYQVQGTTISIADTSGTLIAQFAGLNQPVDITYSDGSSLELRLSGISNATLGGEVISDSGFAEPQEPTVQATVHSTPLQNTPATVSDGTEVATEALATGFTSGYDSTWSYTAETTTNSLLSGAAWGKGPGEGVTLTYSFPQAGATWADDYGNGEQNNGFQGFNATQQAAAREALDLWAEVANIRFVEVQESGSTVGDIRFGFSDEVGGNTAAYAYLPSHSSVRFIGSTLTSYDVSAESGDVWFNPEDYNDTEWQQGSDNFHTMVHEIGHSLGLKHSFDTDGNGTVLTGDQESQKYTTMSYTPHQDMGDVYTDNGNGTFSFQAVSPATPLLYDIQAMQYMYGANYATRTGDDTYTFSDTTPFVEAIWDAAGNDTIDAANQDFAVTIDLNAGALSSVGARYLAFNTPSAAQENLAIAFGVEIENAIGSANGDTLTGNALNNHLTGGAGNDTLNGGAGDDTAIFSGNYADYQVNTNPGGGVDTQVVGADGTDQLISIEYLRFDDQTVSVTLLS